MARKKKRKKQPSLRSLIFRAIRFPENALSNYFPFPPHFFSKVRGRLAVILGRDTTKVCGLDTKRSHGSRYNRFPP
ncbi:hypothetical protein ES703_28572 [subsurface metagenome]